MTLSWMVWTVPTAIFFATIFVTLVGMTVYEIFVPCTERRGFLPIPTTPGDRLFVGLLVSGFFHLAWLGVSDVHVWIATLVALVWMVCVLRWG